MYLLWIFATVVATTNALVGYDCGTHTNVTALSLLTVEDCDIPELAPNTTQTYIQLVQVADYSTTEVHVCKIRVNRRIFRCGWLSRSPVDGGDLDYYQEITGEECRRIQQTRTFRLNDRFTMNALNLNKTTTSSGPIAGELDDQGGCEGVTYRAFGRSWKKVTVTAQIDVELYNYHATVKLKTNQVILRSGTRCNLQEGHCLDPEAGYVFWSPVPEQKCDYERHYEVLYEGPAQKLLDPSYERAREVYSMNTEEVTFALTRKDEIYICGFTLIKTELPKLYIVEMEKGERFIRRKGLVDQNVNIFNYLNAKIVYVERHIRKEMKSLYRNVILQQCELEKQVLKHALTLATMSPDEVAAQLAKAPGHFAHVAGEVLYIVKCVPVEVKLRKSKACYQQLPVYRGNETAFLTPRTRILVRKGTEVDCNPLLPAMNSLGTH